MPDKNLEVNTEGLRTSAEGLRALSERLAHIVGTLVVDLDGLGTPWGDDKTGHQFLSQYGPGRTQVIEGGNALAAVTRDVAKGVETMAKGFKKIDDDAVDTSRGLRRANDDSGDGNGSPSHRRR